MKVGEIMTRDVCLASPSQTLRKAAAEMGKRDIGALPVSDNDRLVGMITDRDIALRGISHVAGNDRGWLPTRRAQRHPSILSGLPACATS
jgi:CBS domain-containing protein